MSIKNLLGLMGLFIVCACATTEPTPVGDVFRESYKVNSVTVNMTEGKTIPQRYDDAIVEFRNTLMTAENRHEFNAYLEEKGDADNVEMMAERYLEWRIDERLTSILGRVSYRGEQSADVDIKITKVTTPNLAAMLLVGEVKNTTYDLKLIDGPSGEAVISYNKPITVVGAPSAGAGGGILGLAMRNTKNQHLNDIETLITALVEHAGGILVGPLASIGSTKNVTVNEAGITPYQEIQDAEPIIELEEVAPQVEDPAFPPLIPGS